MVDPYPLLQGRQDVLRDLAHALPHPHALLVPRPLLDLLQVDLTLVLALAHLAREDVVDEPDDLDGDLGGEVLVQALDELVEHPARLPVLVVVDEQGQPGLPQLPLQVLVEDHQLVQSYLLVALQDYLRRLLGLLKGFEYLQDGLLHDRQFLRFGRDGEDLLFLWSAPL